MKRVFAILLIVVLFLSGCESKTGETNYNNSINDNASTKESNSEEKLNLNYFKMISKYNGWAVADNSKVYITGDEGKTWKDVTPSAEIDSMIGSWYFLNDDTAWVLYHDGGQNGILCETKDGGINWTSQRVPFDMGILYFLQTDHGIWGWMLKDYGVASGDNPVDVYKLLGSKWTPINEGEKPDNPEPGNGALPYGGIKKSFVFMPNSLTGFITVEYRQLGKYGLYITYDSGCTWDKEDIPQLAKFKDDIILLYPPASFAEDKTTVTILPVSIDNFNDYETIFFTSTESGSTWYEASSVKSGKRIIDINIADKKDWYVLTENSLYATTDGGEIWNKLNYPVHTSEIQFIDSQNGWALVKSESGTKIYHTTDGGRSWTNLF